MSRRNPSQTHGGQADRTARSAVSTMADLLQLTRTPVERPQAAERIPVVLRHLHAGECLVLEGAPVDALFFVRAGTFKIFRTDEDGYEQVLAFAIRGEVLGFDALCMASYPVAISALEASAVHVVPCSDIPSLSQALPAFGQMLQHCGSRTLAHSRELVDIMAAVASEVRLARFLIQHSRRMADCGLSPSRFLLRMGRREIASLLGVAHETVSRSFTTLAALGLIQVCDREVGIRDMDGLAAFARSTRRPMDAPLIVRARLPANGSMPAQSRRPTVHRLAA